MFVRLFCSWLTVALVSVTGYLTPRNTEAPFCYVHGNAMSWPFLSCELPAGSRVAFVAKQDGQTLASGKAPSFAGISVSQKKWDVEPGTFTVGVGASSVDLRLEGTFEMDETAPLARNREPIEKEPKARLPF